MNMKEWAKREIEIACERERGNKNTTEWDYGCACYKSAFKAFESLMTDNHSGYSISITKHILNCLIDGKPLTPIEDVSSVWNKIVGDNPKKGYTTYQCNRMSSLFKDVYSDGTVKYSDVDRFRCVNKDNPNGASWSNGFITNLLNDQFPITMPYYPDSHSWVVYCTECLTDPANGDFDTIGVLYIKKPDGEQITIDRFFKDGKNTMVEISREEYETRMNISKLKERKNNEC
jgi:hypothetical protein